MTTKIFVEQLSGNVFKTTANEIFDDRLTLGTEFETCINSDGKHEITGIVKQSEYVTKQFFLISQFTQSEYMLLGDEIIRHGGYWQVDFGSLATVNLPKDSELNLDEILKIYSVD